ncbi:ArsR family transcriptional regulator [Hyphomicrobium nitrativorans NL23]|jgi:DNA-binding transcriptional ArsR family regulator|uniref:ArsR family transcriptional regulator n=1 Tax=Hyphomicrobium nitrativorans NL23 TaxID=1029756 RepID=V5SD57_9HYPH|nr:MULTISPECIES: metalloregulator ArsR/SmtB family transcription factor [Hyphomicrobium]AHB47884.1 ArsR family transcriptional regulator [Hyphomicrobium nitrativorans NL23]HRN88991.1 metalloregulator ArsR/SmtB family transcription factor [Hyphomicrobium sp.]HRQ27507.1 metalloregulator ArsR/SmtB family transcription factor [Hyphomicrobium sp.]
MIERQDQALDRVFHALSDPSRRAMLKRLADGPLTVGELAEPLPMSLAAASRHIKVLEDSGLLDRHVSWRTHTCTLNAKPLAAIRSWVEFYERFWSERFDTLEELFESRRKTRRKISP